MMPHRGDMLRLVLGDTPADVDALVVEAVYSTIEDTARRRVSAAMGPVIADVLPGCSSRCRVLGFLERYVRSRP